MIFLLRQGFYSGIAAMVVKADDEPEARRLANEVIQEDGVGGVDVWVNSDLSTCEAIPDDLPSQVLVVGSAEV